MATGTQYREVSAGRREQFMKELEERIEEARAEHAQFGGVGKGSYTRDRIEEETSWRP